jgi:hypothetical protein
MVPSSDVFFLQWLTSVLRSFTSLIKFIPSCFIFWGYYEWDCFPDFFLSLSLLIRIDFLTWCFAEVFMMFKRFSVAFVGSFRYKIIAPENKDNLTSFFLIWIHYILFSYLISLVKNSNTLLNKSFSQCPASMMLDLGLSKIAFIMLSYIPSITSFFTIFIMKGYWILTRDFFAYWDDHVVFVLDSVYTLYYMYWFAYVEPFLHPWNETNLILVYDNFNVLLNSVCKYFITKTHFLK